MNHEEYYGYLWIIMDTYGYLWILVDTCGYLKIRGKSVDHLVISFGITAH